MKVYFTLRVTARDSNNIISFGEVDNSQELNEAFELRYSVYKERGYIDSQIYPEGKEKDNFDILGKCHYFIAKIDQKIIGFIRVITDDPLPTEKYFTFQEPEVMKFIRRDSRFELGRFIIIPVDKEKNEFLPRGLVMLFLLNTILSFALKNNLSGGYSFVKRTLYQKMKRRHMPVGEIANYTEIYPKDGVLKKYFNQRNNPVIPIYFTSADFRNYLYKHINCSLLFTAENESTYILKSNIYTKILHFFRVI